MPVVGFDDFVKNRNAPGAVINQPGNPHEGVQNFNPTLGASTQPFEPKANPQTSLPQAQGQEQPQQQESVQTPQGEPEVTQISPDSQIVDFDTFSNNRAQKKIQEAGGINPNSKAPIGSIENPTRLSPLSMTDRFALSFGNEKGKVNYLKNKFEDATLDEKQGLLIKDKGAWHKADETSLGDMFKDAWELSKAISIFNKEKSFSEKAGMLKDAVKSQLGVTELGKYTGEALQNNTLPVALNATGYAIGSPGGFAGVAAAGVATGVLRQSFGRYLGTFDATPAEAAKDIALESLMNMGGKFFEVGIAPKLADLANSARGIKRVLQPVAETAESAAIPIENQVNSKSQDIIANVFGAYTKAGPEAINTVIDENGAYHAAYSAISKESSSVGQMQAKAAQGKMDGVKKILSSASDALTNKYGEIISKIKASPKVNNLEISGQEMITNFETHVEESGFGKIVKGRFVAFSPDEKLARREMSYALQAQGKAGLPTENLDEAAETALNVIYDNLKSFKTIKAKGKVAVDVLRDIHQETNQLVSSALGSETTSESGERILAKTSEFIRNSVGENFRKAELIEEYSEANKIYSNYVNAVRNGENVLKSNNPDALQAYTNKLFTKSSEKLGTKAERDLLLELGGDKARNAWKQARIYHAVEKTAEWAPQLGILKNPVSRVAAEAATVAGMAHNPVATTAVGIAALPFVAASSPRLVSKAIGVGTRALEVPAIDYGYTMINSLFKGLGRDGMRQLLQNPNALQHVLRLPAEAGEKEDQEAKDLLIKSGAIPNGQQQQ